VAPLLSAVIPAYNVEKFILAAVESALSQSFRDLEVIVVDDGSTDKTADLVMSLHDSRLKLIRQNNLGLAAARNTGIRASRGKYIGLLDGDDIWLPKKADLQIGIMEEDANIGITYSNSAYIDEAGRFTGQLLISRIKEPSLRELLVRSHILPSSATIRKECFSQAGMFDERLRACEDYEIWVRILHRTSFKARLVSEVLTGYRVRTTSLSMDFDAFLSNARKVVAIFAEHIPEFSEKLRHRALGEVHRIASRKALSDGKMADARRLMTKSIQHCPSILVRDLRGLGTFLLVGVGSLFPERWQRVPYWIARRLMRIFFRCYGGRISIPL
jgi:glycosyltransferase involved in cell wall biosynthesis